MSKMTHKKKIEWMVLWCATNGMKLELEGSCGFGRECVGVSNGSSYADYHWMDEKTYKRLDNNGEVWTPDDAYHKHDCVAVLGRGRKAESDLYDWLQWFDKAGFKVEMGTQPIDPALGEIGYILGKHQYVRMVKQ